MCLLWNSHLVNFLTSQQHLHEQSDLCYCYTYCSACVWLLVQLQIVCNFWYLKLNNWSLSSQRYFEDIMLSSMISPEISHKTRNTILHAWHNTAKHSCCILLNRLIESTSPRTQHRSISEARTMDAETQNLVCCIAFVTAFVSCLLRTSVNATHSKTVILSVKYHGWS